MRRLAFTTTLALLTCVAALAQSAQPPAEVYSIADGHWALPFVAPTPQPLPDAPSATASSPQDEVHLPPSSRPTWAVDRSKLGDKLHYGAASLGSVRNLVETLLITGVPDLPSAPTQPNAPAIVNTDTASTYQDQMQAYGDGMDAWRRTSEVVMRYHEHRAEVGLATAETRQLLSNLALPIALGQEARYRPAPIDATLLQRLTNAASSIVLTESDHGRLEPNYSRLGGTVAAAILGKTLYASTFNAPELQSNHFVTHYIAYSLAGDLATNVAHELLRAAVEPDTEVYNLHGRSTEDSYYPLSAGGKFVYWAHSSYAARNFVQALVTAGLPQIGTEPIDPPPGVITTEQQALTYDQAYVTFGNAIQYWRRHLENDVRYREHRLIGGMAASESQMAIQNLAIPMLFGIDSRYIPLGSSYDAGTRMGHTFRSLIEARTDSGGRAVNLPLILGTAGGALLAKEVYYPTLGTPALETNSVLATTIGLNLLADFVGNLHSEFFRHHGY